MSAWRPTPAERAALSIALRAVSVPDWVSRDDLEQAALIALWRKPPRSQDRAYLVAVLRAAISDEMRRQMGRYTGRHAPMEWRVEHHDSPHHDTPDRMLQVSQAVAALGKMGPLLHQALGWLLTPGDLQDHARGVGLGPFGAGVRVRQIRQVLARAI